MDNSAFNQINISIDKIFNSMRVGVSWKDKTGIYLGCNDYFSNLCGLNKEEVVGKSDKLLPWRKKAKIIKEQENLIIESNRTRTQNEIWLIADGSLTNFIVKRTPLYDSNDITIGIITTVTENPDSALQGIKAKNETSSSSLKSMGQKKLEFYTTLAKEITGHSKHQMSAEAYVSYIHDYLEKIIACMPGNVYWLDKNSVFLGCNDNVAKMLGLHSRTDIIGMTHAETAKLAHWSSGQAESFERDDKEVIATGIPKINIEEPPINDTTGREIHFLTSRVPLRDKEGEVIGIVGISIDITDRKQAERELIKAKEHAEIADRLKSEFIHDMEHDLRTPCSGVYGLSKMLELNETNAEKKETLSDLAKCADEILKYCNSLLDFSKIEAGVYPILSKKFNIKELINSIVVLETPASENKNLLFVSEIADDVPEMVVGDPNRLQRILMNLVGNAIKFTQIGYIKIKIQLAKMEDRKIILHFFVEDTGIGIPIEKQSLIYEKFMRGTPSNRGYYEGIGLGLYNVKKFIIEMNGEIDVDSEEGRGTTFLCTIPFELPLIAEDLLHKEKGVIQVLLVEPETKIRALELKILESCGCHTDIASTSAETLNLIAKKNYDIIFSVVTLNDEIGINLLKKIRSFNNINSKKTIIILATSEEKGLQKNFIEAGANEFLPKPIKVERLEKLLQKYLADKH